jgi:hypothetical protein
MNDANESQNRGPQLRLQIRLLTWIFIFALVVSGLTAIPLETELNAAAKVLGATGRSPNTAESGFLNWIARVQEAVNKTNYEFPFIAYGTDWLAFGHFVIAIAFVGALRDPVRNIWLFRFGIIACGLVVPYALGMGAVRGIPIYWRLIDCSFGIFGLVPLVACFRWTKELSQLNERRVFATQ